MNTRLLRIIVSAVLLAVAFVIEKSTNLQVWQLLLIFLVPYLVIGYDIIWEAIEKLCKGDLFDEDFLMTIATLGALCIGFLPDSDTQFPEAVFVMLFFQVGELFEDYAQEKSKKSISSLMNIRPDSANVERNGEIITINPKEIQIGETIVIKPGEKIPLDGIVLEGKSALNTIALTGESLPRDIAKKDEVISGCINISGLLKVKVTKSFEQSTASKIIDLVENSAAKKSKSENFISKFAKVYTPIVVFAAIFLAFVPSLILGDFSTWLYRALMFLIVSCPCALVVSVPLTFFSSIGGASKKGILVKGGNYMEALTNVSTIVFDKTGTLTKGKFEVTAVHPNEISETELLHLAAHVERFSTHPIAISLRNAYPNEADNCKVENITEISGEGIKANINGDEVCVGNEKMMQNIGVAWHECHKQGTIIHVAINNKYAGHIVISDTIKEDSKQAIKELKTLGIKKLIMLTGDKKQVGESVAKELALDEYYAELLPQDKVEKLKELISKKIKKEKVAFVGDGINDAPVLAISDIGIAMGGLGSDAAIEAADIVLMDDKPSKIAKVIKIARHIILIAKENVVFAIAIKLLVLILATIGVATLWMAVFADVGVTVLAVLNAMRALKTK